MSSSKGNTSAVEQSIAMYAQKLTESGSGEVLSKRQKKRALQKLGKLKKQMSLVPTEGADGANDDNNGSDDDAEEPPAKVQKQEQPTLSKKELKVKLRILNQELADFAQKKQLKLAKKKFLSAVNKGYKLNVHSYTNLINVYVRCNDMEGANSAADEMKAVGIKPNVITFTTLLKGYSELGQINKCRQIFFDEMKDAGVAPNVRTLNAFLRACARTGAAKSAYKAFIYFKELSSSSVASSSGSNSKKKPAKSDESDDDEDDAAGGAGGDSAAGSALDASSYEYIVGILCRSGHLSTAEAIVAEFIATSSGKNGSGGVGANKASAGGVDVMENSAIYLTLAKAYALTGQFDSAKKWLVLTQSVLKMNQNVELKDSMLKKIQQGADGGCGGGKEKGEGKTKEGSSRSVSLFLNHRRSELQGEAHLLEDFLVSVDSFRKNSGNIAITEEELRVKSVQLYLRYLSQVMYFGYDGTTDYDDVIAGEAKYLLPDSEGHTVRDTEYDAAAEAKKIHDEGTMKGMGGRLVLALRDKFGLFHAANQVKASGKDGKKALKQQKEEAMTQIMESLDSQSGHLVFERIFPQFVGIPAPSSSASPAATSVAAVGSAGIAKKGNKNSAVSTSATASGKSSIQEMYEELERETAAAAAAAARTGDFSSNEGQRLELPIKLEICSGNGEWVVAQAAADRGAFSAAAAAAAAAASTANNSSNSNSGNIGATKAVWLALELRCDRIHSTLSQNVFYSHELVKSLKDPISAHQSSNNLAILSGDASKIIPQRFPSSRLSAIFINHPQPPDRVTGGAKDKNQGAHLLTEEFFADLHRVLKPEGTITIVTDNQLYAKSLAESLVEMTERTLRQGKRVGFVSVPLMADATKSLQESLRISSGAATAAGGVSSAEFIQIWRGDPGVEAGHVSAASSYFDRMWDLGQKKRRWFLYVQRL